ncbi:hypothetical protein D3C72_1194010 [compost metagenome]
MIAPWIWLGLALAPTTRFSTASLASCLNCTVVLRPTLKVSQLRIARGCVCSIVTVCLPPLDEEVAALAPSHLASSPRASHNPPSVLPSGTSEPLAAAAARAAACAACWAATAAAARFKLFSDFCNCWRDWACCLAALPMPAMLPSGMRPVRWAVDWTAFLSANQPGLNARVWACATPLALPAIAKAAKACDNGLRCQEGAPPGWREPVGAGMWCGRDVATGVADVDEDMA